MKVAVKTRTKEHAKKMCDELGITYNDKHPVILTFRLDKKDVLHKFNDNPNNYKGYKILSYEEYTNKRN